MAGVRGHLREEGGCGREDADVSMEGSSRRPAEVNADGCKQHLDLKFGRQDGFRGRDRGRGRGRGRGFSSERWGARRLAGLLAITLVSLVSSPQNASAQGGGLVPADDGVGRGRFVSLSAGGTKHIPWTIEGDERLRQRRSVKERGGSGVNEKTARAGGEGSRGAVIEQGDAKESGGVFGDVLDALRPLAEALFGKEHFRTRSHAGAVHPYFLAPFWLTTKGELEANKIGSDDWLGYGGQASDDSTIQPASVTAFQGEIARLLAIPRETPVGGHLISKPSEPTKYAWNGPSTGGVNIDVFGMGFGWDRRECTAACLSGGECVPPYCLHVSAQVGQTKSSLVQWYSDSSISLKLPPGLGESISLNITSGRNQQVADLPAFFTYDSPVEKLIKPTNAPTAGIADMTIIGKNFGNRETITRGVQVGESSCTTVQWFSDSQIACRGLQRGTGSIRTVKVNVGGEFIQGEQVGGRVNPAGGLTQAFSYDRPVITSIFPTNGPAKGFETAMTIFGANFGMGPADPAVECEGDADGITYLLKPLDPAYCFPAFVRPKGESFKLQMTSAAEPTVPLNLYWDNIIPTSLAHDPIACAFAAYQCDWLKIALSCQFIKDACKPISDVSVPALPLDEVPQSKTTCSVINRQTGLGFEPCAPHVVGSYIKDGVNCDYTDPVLSPPVNYFKARGLEANSLLCDITPKLESQCNGNCIGLGCCNPEGSFGARVAGTECTTLMWLSDSSLICRVPPGLGSGLDVMVAIDDFKGQQVDSAKNVFSFDAPQVNSIEGREGQPTTGGGTITLLGSSFGPFQCNRTWCSFDPLQLCDSTGCSTVGTLPKRNSKVISHSASILGTYVDGSGGAYGRSACAETRWMSDTAMTCKLQAGVGDLRSAQVTVFRQLNNFKDLNSDEAKSVAYAPPEPIRVTPQGAAGADGVNVTVLGKQFGVYDSTPMARLGGTACASTSWRSDSSLVCKVPGGIQGPALDCSFNPLATAEECLAQTCKTCDSWRSNSGCQRQYDTTRDSSGQGICHSVVVTVGRLRNQLTQAFSYDATRITALKPTNGPTTGNFDVTILGKSFGTMAYNTTASVGGSPCKTMAWTSDSSIACKVGLGIGKDAGVRLVIDWNELDARTDGYNRFTYNRPVISQASTYEIPTKGAQVVTLKGENFGSFDEFRDPNKPTAPFPPKAKIGDTTCETTFWVSDSQLRCSVGGPLSPTYPKGGAGVGKSLPVVVALADQIGTMAEPFAYTRPQITGLSSQNSPASGAKKILIGGTNFGVYDFTPVAKIGQSDCKHTEWQSDTSLRCTTAEATKFLAGQNIQLQVEVKVGLGHRLQSEQVGVLESVFNYDFPVNLVFQLNNTEINLIIFTSAVVLAAAVICCLHIRYQDRWKAASTPLPVKYARTPTFSQQAELKSRKKIAIPPAEQPKYESSSSELSSSSSESDDEDEGKDEKKLIKGPGAGPDDVHISIDSSDSSESDSEREKRLERKVLLDEASNLAGPAKAAKMRPGLGKDVATGQSVAYTDFAASAKAAPYGKMQVALTSIPTPIPKRHDHARREKERTERKKAKGRRRSFAASSRAQSSKAASSREEQSEGGGHSDVEFDEV